MSCKYKTSEKILENFPWVREHFLRYNTRAIMDSRRKKKKKNKLDVIKIKFLLFRRQH